MRAWQWLPILLTLVAAATGTLLIIVLEVFIGDLLQGVPTELKFVFLAALVILVALTAWLLTRLPRNIVVRIEAHTIVSEADRLEFARRGFIGFLPLANAADWEPPVTADQIQARLLRVLTTESKDLVEADRRWNFTPTLQAIATHRLCLEHCWLLWKPGQARARQMYAATQLVTAIKAALPRCQEVHWQPWEIVDENEVEVISKTRRLVTQVLTQAAQLPHPIPAREIVADISTGVRSMILGMTLACLHEDQDLSFMATEFDDHNQPTGKLVPTCYHFNPELQPSRN